LNSTPTDSTHARQEQASAAQKSSRSRCRSPVPLLHALSSPRASIASTVVNPSHALHPLQVTQLLPICRCRFTCPTTACIFHSTRFNCIHCCEPFSCAPPTSGAPGPAHLCHWKKGLMELEGIQSPKEIDFANLTAECLWSIFLSKSCYGGALAYAVLSRASKMGCVCSVSLEKLAANRMKQREAWCEWCSLTCNLLWARRFSFKMTSERASYKNRLIPTWSEPVSTPFPALPCSEITIPANSAARIASLAVNADSCNLLDQALRCACDDRQIIISELWLKIKNDFICNALWYPPFEFSFNEVRHIRPTADCNHHLSPESIADTWLRIVFHLKKLFVSPSLLQPIPPDDNTVWSNFICCSSFEIPSSERAVIMWIWLLWSSNPLSFLVSSKLHSDHAPSLDVPNSSLSSRSVEDRLTQLTALRAKRLITNTEFKKKRLCILGSI